MSSLALTYSAQTQAPLDPRAHWITAEEQFKRLCSPIAAKVKEFFASVISDLVAGYAVDESLTNWYTALSRLKLNLSSWKMPPLPKDIHEIWESRCPIYDGQEKPDKTPYKIKDTHFLSIIFKEFNSIDRLANGILKTYKAPKSSNENSVSENSKDIFFAFKVRYEEECENQAYTPFPDTESVLMTKEILPGSSMLNWPKQKALVNTLSQKAGVEYDVATVQQAFTAIAIHGVATGEALYSTRKVVYSSGEGERPLYTRVKETAREITTGKDCHLITGSVPHNGMYICIASDEGSKQIGVGVIRKLSVMTK